DAVVARHEVAGVVVLVTRLARIRMWPRKHVAQFVGGRGQKAVRPSDETGSSVAIPVTVRAGAGTEPAGESGRGESPGSRHQDQPTLCVDTGIVDAVRLALAQAVARVAPRHEIWLIPA